MNAATAEPPRRALGARLRAAPARGGPRSGRRSRAPRPAVPAPRGRSRGSGRSGRARSTRSSAASCRPSRRARPARSSCSISGRGTAGSRRASRAPATAPSRSTSAWTTSTDSPPVRRSAASSPARSGACPRPSTRSPSGRRTSTSSSSTRRSTCAENLAKVLAEAARVTAGAGPWLYSTRLSTRGVLRGKRCRRRSVATPRGRSATSRTTSSRLPPVEYLTQGSLATAAAPAGLTFRRSRVLYPLAYETRGLRALVLGRRPPSRFDLWVARGHEAHVILLVNPRATRPKNRRFPLSVIALGAALPKDVSWEIVDGNLPDADLHDEAAKWILARTGTEDRRDPRRHDRDARPAARDGGARSRAG